MYTAYYYLRDDNDGELVMVISDEDTSPFDDTDLDWIRMALQLQMNAAFGEIGIGWFVQRSGDADFPAIWDNHPERTAKEYEKSFTINFNLTDHEGNEFHLIRSFTTEAKELACQESLIMEQALQRAYPGVIGISIQENSGG